jgi:nucleotidyltransferase/DNA polymerase involved in DNA repair
MTDKIEELIERLRVMGPAVTCVYGKVNRLYAKLNDQPEPPAVTLSDAEEAMIEAADALAALRTQRKEVAQMRELIERLASEPFGGEVWERSRKLERYSTEAAAIRNLKSQDEPR